MWQLTVGVLVAMMIGVFVGRGPLVVNQAASSAVLIATIMPPGTSLSYERMVDALVGGLIGVLVMAVLPRNPTAEARRTVAMVLDLGSDVLYDVARCLRDRDTDRIRAGLQVARASQNDVTQMDRIIADGVEQVQLSPLLWGGVASSERWPGWCTPWTTPCATSACWRGGRSRRRRTTRSRRRSWSSW